MTRRELFAMFGSAALLRGQTCNVATYPTGFVGPKIDATRAVTGFGRPFDFGADPVTGNVPYDGTLGGYMFRETTSSSVYPNCKQVVHHPGMDINKGSGWEDFDQPVYACADGVVTYVRPTKNDINPKNNKAYGTDTNNPTTQNYTVGQWMTAVFGSGLPAAVTGDSDQFVEFTGLNSWVGVILRHFYMGKIYYSLYGHVMQIDRNVVQWGKAVCKGTQIAKIGSIGATASHLHFEIRKPTHPHASTEKGFCENTSDAYLLQYYHNPVRKTYTDDSLPFVDNHPSYNALIANEIATINKNDPNQYPYNPNADMRFISATGSLQQQSQLPIGYEGLEVRMIPYSFSGSRTVQVYHFLDPKNEQGRFASFWDPDTNSFRTIPTLKLD